MNKSNLLFFSVGLLFLCLLLPSPSLEAQETLRTSAGILAKEYLPGDFVHVVVQAPADTAQITAIMPDGKSIGLVRERATNVWHGLWEIPISFKKGAYKARLNAVDIEGNIFEGQTDSFTVGELALITLVGKPTREAARREEVFQQVVTVEAPSAELIKAIRALIAQTPTAPIQPPRLKTRERVRLVEQNLNSAKSSYARGVLQEAATFFRIVLFLDPEQKEASRYLIEINEKLGREAARQRRAFYLVYLPLGIIGFIAIMAVIYFVSRALLTPPPPPPAAPAAPEPAPQAPKPELTPEEKQKLWYEKVEWTKNPFSADDFKQMPVADHTLEPDGLKNFIKACIVSAGGEDFAPFTHAALDEIHRLSRGKPSAAVRICGWAVNKAIERELEFISAELIAEYEAVAYNRILIADDEEIVLTTLEGILRKGGGYETDVARDGEEALKKIKENVYGLILLDIAMPKIDGYEVLKQARELYPELPVVFVSGKGVADRVMESLTQYKLTALIEKPFTPEKVLNVVAASLKSTR